MAIAGDHAGHTDLTHALLQFWEEYTGSRPDGVQAIVGERAVAVRLTGILALAERQMAGTQAGRAILDRLVERILEQAQPQLCQLLEGILGQEGVQAQIHLDAARGSVVGFFWLD